MRGFTVSPRGRAHPAGSPSSSVSQSVSYLLISRSRPALTPPPSLRPAPPLPVKHKYRVASDAAPGQPQVPSTLAQFSQVRFFSPRAPSQSRREDDVATSDEPPPRVSHSRECSRVPRSHTKVPILIPGDTGSPLCRVCRSSPFSPLTVSPPEYM